MNTMDLQEGELQRWSCYVDDIDETHVHLVMADETVDSGDERETGSFPRQLLDHLDPVEGQYVTVRVMADSGIQIENTPISDEDEAEGRRQVDELLGLLIGLRREEEL